MLTLQPAGFIILLSTVKVEQSTATHTKDSKMVYPTNPEDPTELESRVRQRIEATKDRAEFFEHDNGHILIGFDETNDSYYWLYEKEDDVW